MAGPNGLLASLQNRQPAYVTNYKGGSDTESDDTIPGYLSKKKTKTEPQNQGDKAKAATDGKADSDGDAQEEVKKVKKKNRRKNRR